MNLISPTKVAKKHLSKPEPADWTAVIPAAGRGSRLGYDKPKILYPIADRPILDWLIDLLEPLCERLIFVLSPSGKDHVVPFLEQRLKGRYEIAIQPEPKGMADAIYQTVPNLKTKYTLIIWGDQVAIRPKTIESIIKIQQEVAGVQLTLPLVRRNEPYVHYATDKSGQFTNVLERREGTNMPHVGQSDCGLFAFTTKRLKEVFALEIKQGITYSQATKEWNFLPLLPQFDTGGNSVYALRLNSLEETIGANDAKDVAQLEAYLRRRS
jgi:bifunctional UDP-N-acetylglucosamine pyrophosphorylase / glucosamine-1-phosphate N-acetyltransferase